MPNSLSALILQISHYGQRKKYAFFITEAFAETRDRFMSGFFDISDEESDHSTLLLNLALTQEFRDHSSLPFD